MLAYHTYIIPMSIGQSGVADIAFRGAVEVTDFTEVTSTLSGQSFEFFEEVVNGRSISAVTLTSSRSQFSR